MKVKKGTKVKEPKMVDHVVTQEDIDNNPEAGLVVGETVQIPEVSTATGDKIVFALRGGTTREFSREVHGDAFEALADEFEAKHRPTGVVRDRFNA